MSSQTPGTDLAGSQSGTPAKPVKRRKHLMDPNAPREVRNVAAEKKSLSRVQQWVMSVLIVTTIFHLSMGLVIGSLYVGTSTPGAEAGLNIIASIFMVIGIAAAFLVHRKSPLTPWLLLGVVPGLIGWWLLTH